MMALVYAVHRGKKDPKRKPEDFMPRRRKDGPDDEELLLKAKAMCLALGGTINT